MIGRRIAQYEVVEKLGEGGMGEVWRALDGALDRETAIKVLPEALARRLERGPPGVEETLFVGVQIAEALEAAHAQGWGLGGSRKTDGRIVFSLGTTGVMEVSAG